MLIAQIIGSEQDTKLFRDFFYIQNVCKSVYVSSVKDKQKNLACKITVNIVVSSVWTGIQLLELM